MLDRETWNARRESARESLRGNNVPERVTKATGSRMTIAMAEIGYLNFGIREDLKSKLSMVQNGAIKLSRFGNARLICELERPVTYNRVRIKAKKLGLIN